jgi:RNA polymerase sigma-70 factor (ECF subfamily)
MNADDERSRAPETASDEALVRATMRGDEEAFARLVRTYLRKAMAVALEYASARADAEDIVQDTFRRVLENLGRFDDSRAFAPWFFTVLRNTARNAAKSRRLRSHEAIEPGHASLLAGPYEDARRDEMRRSILDAMSRLPPMQRSCFRLCVVEGFTSAEAATALGIAESTVRVHVFKARGTMSGLLESWRSEVEEA